MFNRTHICDSLLPSDKKCLEGKLLATACASLELKWFRSCPTGPVPCGRWSLGLFQGKSKETYGLWPMAYVVSKTICVGHVSLLLSLKLKVEDPAWLHWDPLGSITTENASATAKWPVHLVECLPPWLEAPARPSRVRPLGMALTRSASTLSPARRHLKGNETSDAKPWKNGHETRCLWHVTLEIPIHLGKSMNIIAFWMHLIHLHILPTDCAIYIVLGVPHSALRRAPTAQIGLKGVQPAPWGSANDRP